MHHRAFSGTESCGTIDWPAFVVHGRCCALASVAGALSSTLQASLRFPVLDPFSPRRYVQIVGSEFASEQAHGCLRSTQGLEIALSGQLCSLILGC